MPEINHERKTIFIRWHGLRKYKGVDVVGLRGFPDPNLDGEQRYELSLENGLWECLYFMYDADGVIGYEPRFKPIKRDADLYAVIRASEEHAYTVYHDVDDSEDDEDETEYGNTVYFGLDDQYRVADEWRNDGRDIGE